VDAISTEQVCSCFSLSTWHSHNISEIKDEWLNVTDNDYEDEMEKYAKVGLSNDNKIFLALGKV
jgi:hypothetical protein